MQRRVYDYQLQKNYFDFIFLFIVYMVWKEQKASLCIQINTKNLLRPKDPKEQGSH